MTDYVITIQFCHIVFIFTKEEKKKKREEEKEED